MRVAVMQPYFFPYIGYFQLIDAVDAFVIFDDVSFRKRSWISRNYVLLNGSAHLMTLAIRKASQNRLICEHEVADEPERLLRTIYHCYSKAPCYRDAVKVVEQALEQSEKNLAVYLSGGLKATCAYLGLEREWMSSSRLDVARQAGGEARIVAICNMLGATEYVNLPGGKALYNEDVFERAGLRLRFLQPRIAPYPQFEAEFVAGLSIIDVLMFNGRDRCRELLAGYRLE